MRVLTISLVSLFMAGAATKANAQTDIGTAIGTPGSVTWSAICPATATFPIGASQISACAGANCNVSRVTIDNTVFPRAVCADGTPGVFYVRPGVGNDVDKWVLHVQGGGSCRNYEDCLARWCGTQGNLPYTANKMSSDWDQDGTIDLPLQGQAGGMIDDIPANNFSTWTHVWFYYCSADAWMGRATDVPYTDPAGVNDFTIHQRGHTILSAARRMLRQRGATAGWTADDGTAMPDIDDATDIIFSGTSAGGTGAIQNVDWFLTPFGNANRLFIMDGVMDMTDDALLGNDIWIDLDGNGVGDTQWYSHRITMSLDSWTSGWNQAVNAFVDESCRAVYEPLNRLDRCSYKGTLLWLMNGGVPFIETNTFIRFDLEDTVVRRRWNAQWPTGEQLMIGQNGRYTTRDDFTVLARESLDQIHSGAGRSVTGLFAPRCAQHVGLESTPTFALHTTRNTSLLAGIWAVSIATSNAHDAIWNWYSTGGSVRWVDTDDVNDPTLPNDPVTDPVLQFSAGPNCAY